MQMYKDGENIGYTVPAPVVRHVFPNSPVYGLVRPEDIIVSIDGHAIAEKGIVEFHWGERTSYTHYIDMHQMGERIQIQLLRASIREGITLELTKQRSAFKLVPKEQYERMPQYFIFGGIVFTPLTKNLLKARGRNWRTKAPKNLLCELHNWPTDTRREVIVTLQVLTSGVNRGYHDISSRIIEEVNGVPVADFADFYEKVMHCSDAYVVFADRKKFRIVIDREKACAAHRRILATYRISWDRSADLRTQSKNDRSGKNRYAGAGKR